MNKNIKEQTTTKEQTKTEFILNVQKWSHHETQIKLLNEKLKNLREEKNDFSEKICKYISENNMENANIKITNGEIKLFEKKEYQPLSYSYIDECLQKIINNKSQIEYILNYLKKNREIKTYLDIKKTTTPPPRPAPIKSVG